MDRMLCGSEVEETIPAIDSLPLYSSGTQAISHDPSRSMQRIIRLESLTRSRNQISMIFGLDDLRFETSYWYGDVDLHGLERRFGNRFMEKLCFHIMAFEANKLVSLKPDAFDLGPFARFHTQAFAHLWKEIVRGVWAEWRYENNLPEYEGPEILGAVMPSDGITVEPESGEMEVLSFCGGGKDSLVSMKLLERSGMSYGSFAYAHSIYGPTAPQHHLIDRLLDNGSPGQRHRLWAYDSFVDSPVLELCPEYGVSGITAAETPSSIVAALPIVLEHGYRHVVLGHERSANVGNLIWPATGEDVNHQWGKSYEAERLLNDYIGRELVSGFSYFSILQPVYDVVIFNLLRRDSDAVQATHSCNVRKPWCCRCPKCAYVWLNYMAYLDTDLVNGIFGENLFDLEENRLSYRQMLGLEEHTPFECIGQIDEVRLAFELCRRKGVTGAAMEEYVAHFPDPDVEPILQKYLSIDRDSMGIPSHYAGAVLAQMKEGVAEARRYIGDILQIDPR